jgi:hypothetical protein
MRSCGEAGREREVRRVNKNLAYGVLEREASSRRIVARWVRRKTGRMNRLRWVIGDEQRNFKPDGRRVKARIGFGEPTAVIVDPNADGSKRPGTLDNQVKVIPDAIDIASDDQQPAFCGRNLARTRGASSGGTQHNPIPKAIRRPTLRFNRDRVKAAAAVSVTHRSALDGQGRCGEPL